MPDLDILRQLTSDVGADTALKLLGMFKVDADKRVAVIGAYLQHNGAISDLRIQAHSLKGLCNTYGAVDGGEAARVLQEACELGDADDIRAKRSEEHTSELQSHHDLVCRLLLEKKKKKH